jgi:hypothetical protein
MLTFLLLTGHSQLKHLAMSIYIYFSSIVPNNDASDGASVKEDVSWMALCKVRPFQIRPVQVTTSCGVNGLRVCCFA